MKLIIRNLADPLVERSAEETFPVPQGGATIRVSFLPLPQFHLTAPSITVTYEVLKDGNVEFTDQDMNKWCPFQTGWKEAWQILMAFIAVENYLVGEINYAPQLARYILKNIC